MAWSPFAALFDIQRTVHAIKKQVDHLTDQSAEIQGDVTAIETSVGQINDGVTAATALIVKLEGQVASGQPVDPATLASLKQAVADIGTAGAAVTALAPPAA